ncbi:MAG: nucleoside recognition domain-containing protein, partial [Desulfatirhabdiaceae bacterium]|nr:nucleoside recognition domain-containing protein [Desulfatirhabdiaceae bacterium]
SVIVWALSAFPRNITYSKDFSRQIQTLQQKAAAAEDRQASTDFSARSALEKETQVSIETIKRNMQAEKIENSYMGRLGKMIAPVFSPLGIDWRGSVALLSGFVAKEIVVSTMGILYATEGDKDSEALRTALLSSGMTRLSAVSMLVFVLLYLPCLATMAAIRRELRSWKWMLFSVGYSTSLAWVMAFLVFQGGKLLSLDM